MNNVNASTGTGFSDWTATVSRSSSGSAYAAAIDTEDIPGRKKMPHASDQSLKLAISLRNKAANRKILLFAGLEEESSVEALATAVGQALVEIGEQPVLLVVPDSGDRSLLAGERGELRFERREVTSDSTDLDYSVEQVWKGLSVMRVRLAPNRSRSALVSAFGEILEECRPRFRFILIAASADAGNVNTKLMALLTDGVVLAVEQGRQTRTHLMEGNRKLAADSVPLLGFVLTESDPK